MRAPQKFTTILSAKGQITLPKALRDKLGWPAGTHLEIEERPGGVLLKKADARRNSKPASSPKSKSI